MVAKRVVVVFFLVRRFSPSKRDDRCRGLMKLNRSLTLLHVGGVESLGGGLDGGSALGETRDVAKSVHG